MFVFGFLFYFIFAFNLVYLFFRFLFIFCCVNLFHVSCRVFNVFRHLSLFLSICLSDLSVVCVASCNCGRTVCMTRRLSLDDVRRSNEILCVQVRSSLS